MDLVELGRLADENLAGTWTTIGGATGAVGGSERCRFVATGLPIAFFNGALAAAPVDDPEQVVAAAVAFMAEHDVPWLLWVREGVDAALLAAGRRAGLTDTDGPPGMALPTIGEIPSPPVGLDMWLVEDRAGIESARRLLTRGFEVPPEVADVMVSEALVDDERIAIVVGSVDGTPVSSALVSITGSTAGIYNVATPPEFRCRGYGAAATWAAIGVGARLGCEHAVLQASDMGAPIYRAMGFVDVGRYVRLVGPPPGGDLTIHPRG